MTRAEFVQAYRYLVKMGRRENFPDIRPSEEAAAVINDTAKAITLWRESRQYLAAISVEQFIQQGGAGAYLNNIPGKKTCPKLPEP